MVPLSIARRALPVAVWALASIVAFPASGAEPETRPRARDLGLQIGRLPPGESNDITDVAGVLVGHYTLHEGRRFHTGITAILPRAGDLYRDRVPAAIVVANGFGKLLGATQVNELGELETPILLTGTLNVFRVADGLVEYLLGRPGMEEVYSINPVVGETNDGYLSDIRHRPLGAAEVGAALEAASAGPVEQGAVGAGSGTVCFGFKGGIGSSSRQLDESDGGWTVGALVQSNFGRREGLRLHSLPERVGGLSLGEYLHREAGGELPEPPGGSLMIVVATDAPLDHRNLARLARRGFYGMARSGGSGGHGSGDYAIAFSTARDPRPSADRAALPTREMSRLFEAVAEAVEEAIVDSLLTARTVEGLHGTARAIPVGAVRRLLESSPEGWN